MLTKLMMAAAIAFSLGAALPVSAQEHPSNAGTSEHPSQHEKATHVSKQDISAGIKKDITAEKKKSSDGKFHVQYDDHDLTLDLIKVHDDRLSDLGDGKYFACVDMKATNGKTYDIDFFLDGQPGSMKVTETSVHKIDGKPLYNWKEEDGKWKKVPIG
ncbi:MAG: hypothetical protein ABI217_06705 [Chthoniobacterales bacterium]